MYGFPPNNQKVLTAVSFPFAETIAAGKKHQRMLLHLNAKGLLNVGLYLLYPRVTELPKHPAIGAYHMVVLLKLERLLELRTPASEMVLDNQFAILKQKNSIVQGGAANPVFVVLHPYVQRLNIKMTLSSIDLLKNRVSLGSLAVPLALKIVGENLLHRLIMLHLELILINHCFYGLSSLPDQLPA